MLYTVEGGKMSCKWFCVQHVSGVVYRKVSCKWCCVQHISGVVYSAERESGPAAAGRCVLGEVLRQLYTPVSGDTL